MRYSCFLTAAASLLALPTFTSAASNEVLEEVIVTATLRPQPLLEVPSSVTVLDDQTLRDAGQQHFQDVLGLVPNLNWAGGTSRPRYFQIRGIGEREQYEGAPNPSVGFLIDDIDFSGLGMPATLFDVKQIEVLRGPQGTRYGANALAGLIAVRGNDPEQEAHYGVEASVGDYNTRSLGVTATAPIESLNSAWRMSVQQYRSDGFRSNPYLQRKDTDGRDELTGRFKWRWQVNDSSTLDFTLLHANLDNGYDAWAIDNSRTSLSDKPGKDAQRSTGAALKLNSKLDGDLLLTITGTAADTKSVNSYDGDWGNTQSWRDVMHTWSLNNGVSGNAWQGFVYDYDYRSDRDLSTRSVEARIASNHDDTQLNWLLGVYALNLREHLQEIDEGVYANPIDPSYDDANIKLLDSRYAASNVAVFGELDGRLGKSWSWSAGLRGEQRHADYSDKRTRLYGTRPSVVDKQQDDLWGGQLSLSYDLNPDASLYASVSRGYKAGGFNLGKAYLLQQRFAAENVLSYELGSKGRALNDRIYFDLAFFYEQRDHMQVLNGVQEDPIGNPNSYTFFTGNARSGYNAGAESSLRFKATSTLELGGSLGLLRSRVSLYLDGVATASREQPHAPEYTASIYGVWRPIAGWMLRLDVNAKDNFYFSIPPNNTQSHAYSLTNVKLGYEVQQWSIYGWVRNVFDKDYAVRGFYFGNEPPYFPTTLYVQHGEPRQLGVTGSWKF